MIILILLVLVIGFLNYAPGTFLSGWDTIHSEFNPMLDLQRTIFAVWQEYRGVGVVDGMGHAADLVRQIVLLPFYLVIPPQFVRYGFHLAMLLVGTLGIYVFITRILLQNQHSRIKKLTAIVAGVLYVLNFGTISYFFVPLEAFSVFYATFPWLMFALLVYLRQPNKKHLLLFALVSLLATPAFYIPTLFLVYAGMLCLLLAVFVISTHRLRIVTSVVVTTLAINAFWLLPFGYFVLDASHFPREGYINLMSTEDTQLLNKRRGTIADLLMLRGYYYDASENGQYIMQPWRAFQAQPFTYITTFLLGIVTLIGLWTKNPYKKYVLPVFVVSAALLLSNTYPLSLVFDSISQFSPFLGQVFRSPYTKFIVPTIFAYTIFFSLGTFVLLVSIPKRLLAQIMMLVILTGIVCLNALPVFQGDLFYKTLETKIPKDYFSLFDFFKKQNPDSRIGFFPQYTYWGWSYYSWGYSGSGFVWWGLPQSTMDRAFDVWNSANENYYWEISQALYSKDATQFSHVLKKYGVSWIVLDNGLKNYYASPLILYRDELTSILNQRDQFEPAAQFGTLTVYKFLGNEDVSYIHLLDNAPRAVAQTKWNDADVLFAQQGSYITTTGPDADIAYPFYSLFTGRGDSNLPFTAKETSAYISFSAQLPKAFSGKTLVIPAADAKEFTLYTQGLQPETASPPVEIFIDQKRIAAVAKDSVQQKILLPLFSATTTLEVRIPKTLDSLKYTSTTDPTFNQTGDIKCLIEGFGTATQIMGIDAYKPSVLMHSQNSHNCKDVLIPDVSQYFGYYVKVTSKWNAGKKLLFKIINRTTDRIDNEIYVSANQADWTDTTFIIPPQDAYGAGYTLSFDNESIGNQITENSLAEVAVWQIPYRLLKQMYVQNSQITGASVSSAQEITRVNHPNPSYYAIDLSQATSKTTLVLNQAFDNGWLAFERVPNFPYFRPLGQHVLVNNWANGWEISEELRTTNHEPRTIYLLFWPQALEYVGFLILGGFLVVIIIRNQKHTIDSKDL